MRKEYLPTKDGLRDLRAALVLRAKPTRTPQEQSEFDSLVMRLDRLRAVEFVEIISCALNGGMALRPERREPIPINETFEAERARRERQARF